MAGQREERAMAGGVREAAGVQEAQRTRVAARDLTLAYGDTTAATDLTFDVRPGEFVSLIGPSGCGKSSALRAVGGLLAPVSGELLVDGTPVDGPRPRDVAFVFQDLALYPWRSAVRNVEIALQFAGVGRAERRARALDALRAVGLGDVPHRFPHQLSGGMRQRVAIARALVSDASILLLDEPFAALDELSRLKIGEQLVTLLEEHGKTVLFVTHSLSEAAYLSDRIIVMTPRPATIKEVIEVPLPRPREPQVLRTPEFHALTDRLSALLLEDDPGDVR
ncbi:nitrate ABC transporter ATP-binding protein [Actinomadura coerulea]|nr:nitrate ABC transporter ATP-binding protein [Actinomadura coerulea]